MKNLEKLFNFLAVCLFCIGTASCDDEKELYFTQTKVEAYGPCLTGVPHREVPLTDNTLSLSLGSSDFVNVQGGTGKYTVTSENTNYATAEISEIAKNSIWVKSTKFPGTTRIHVIDDDGNSGSFIVDVYYDDVYEVDATSGRSIICGVEGVSDADSAIIASEVIQNNQDARFIIRNFDLKWRPESRAADTYTEDLLVTLYEMTIQNNKKETIIKGRTYPEWAYNWIEDAWWTWMLDISIDEEYKKDENDYSISYYYVDNEDGIWFVKDQTTQYKKKYNDVSSVLLWLPVKEG